MGRSCPGWFFIVVMGALLWGGRAGALDFYVAVDGSDGNAGTREGPFRSLERARDAIRALRQSGQSKGAVTVWLRGGIHHRFKTFELAAEDSGSPQDRICYRGLPGETVVISGGKPIPWGKFRPVKAREVLDRVAPVVRGRLLQADLKALGISGYGPAGLGGAELFCNGRRMTPARWPDKGWALARRNDQDHATWHFTFPGKAPNAWATLDGVFLHGYWRYDYQDQVKHPRKVDASEKTIAFDSAFGDGALTNRRFYAFNVLEELDHPGEWYIDRGKGILYILPPDDVDRAEVVLSVLARPFVAMRHAAHVSLRSLTFEAAQGHALVIEGGTDNRITGCVIRHVAGDAVILSGGTGNGIEGCDLYEVGSGGVVMRGGNRRTLAPAGLFTVNCHIHHYACLGRSYQPAVQLSGVGNRMAHNRIHDAPHTAVLYDGNDHCIEFNEIHDVVQTTSDAGVLYSGYDWTFRGNRVRHNFFHHIGHMPGGYTRVVYMDDAHCATETFGNVFYKTHEAVWIGGGRDNVVENNIFIECTRPVSIDNRGLYWSFLNPGGDIRETGMYGKLTAVPYDRPPWSLRYPRLARILEEQPRAPLGNTLERNLSVRSGWRDPEKACRRSVGRNHVDTPYMRIRDNHATDGDPGFVDAADMNFALKDDAAAYEWIPGFQKIPFDRIGPYKDATRASWPLQGVRAHAGDTKTSEKNN